MRALGYVLLGSVAFVLITVFEQVPMLGWAGWIVSLAAWWWLSRELAADGGGVLSGAALGGVTGLVGSFSAWLAQLGNLFGFTTGPGERVGAGFGAVGATLGLVYWPIIGAGFCALCAVAFASSHRRRAL